MRAIYFVLVILTTQIFGKEALTQENWNHLINVAGRQRMLSQKMTKEALMIHLGIEPERAKSDLQSTRCWFVCDLNTLANGSEFMRLKKIDEPRVQMQITKILQFFNEFQKLLVVVEETGQLNNAQLNELYAGNLILLEASNRLVKMLEYTSRNKSSTVVNLAGKQRMLSQRFMKELLFLTANIHPEIERLRTQETITLFETTLRGLEEGDASLSLPAAKDSKIVNQLKIVREAWNRYKSGGQKLQTSTGFVSDDWDGMYDLSLQVLQEMNKAVEMYAETPSPQ